MKNNASLSKTYPKIWEDLIYSLRPEFPSKPKRTEDRQGFFISINVKIFN